MREPIIHYSSPNIDPPPLANNPLQNPIHSYHHRYAKHKPPSILIIPHDASHSYNNQAATPATKPRTPPAPTTAFSAPLLPVALAAVPVAVAVPVFDPLPLVFVAAASLPVAEAAVVVADVGQSFEMADEDEDE